jgi:restriction system protein
MSEPLPDYQAVMLPLLRHVATAQQPVAIIDAMPDIAREMQLTEAQLAERLPSGRQGVFHNRLHWAKQYLTRAGLLENVQRGRFQITDEGRRLLSTNPHVVNNDVLSRYASFVAWKDGEQDTSAPATAPSARAVEDATPLERIESAQKEIEASLRADLFDRVRQMSPADFEELIIRLLVRMGYGQGRDEMAEALGGSGDGGVDGVVHQDPLGLDRVYIQAKRYKEGNTVGPHDINSFIGALNIKKANKGLFVTASSFTRQAREHALAASTHVVLIDGQRLADLMVRHKVGVRVQEVVELKVIDEGFFTE